MARRQKKLAGRLETPIRDEILLAIGSRRDVRLFRTPVLNARSATTGKTFQVGQTGQADLSGIIAPEGWRLEIETKREIGGEQEEKQKDWQAMIERFGGCYILARSVEEATRLLDAWIAQRRARGCPHCAAGSLEHVERCRCACHAANRSHE